MIEKLDTLYGGREEAVMVIVGPGGGAIKPSLKEEVFFVKQFLVEEYRTLFPLLDDEIALVAKACGKTVQEIGKVAPKSYEQLYTAMREVNGEGFFYFAQRQLERGMENLKAMPPEMLERTLKSVSPPPSPGSRPPRT